MAISNAAYKAKVEEFCKRATYTQAKGVYEEVNSLWNAASALLKEFVDAQGPNARHANGLTADFVRCLPEYKRLSAKVYATGEQAKTFNGVFTRVFKREHVADIQKGREERAKDHKARWAALCATV